MIVDLHDLKNKILSLGVLSETLKECSYKKGYQNALYDVLQLLDKADTYEGSPWTSPQTLARVSKLHLEVEG